MAREIRLPVEANRVRELVHVFEDLRLAVVALKDPGLSPERTMGSSMDSDQMAVVDLASGKAESLAEFAPALKGQSVARPDVTNCFAGKATLALKGKGEKSLWLVDMSKRTAVSIETSDSPGLAISGDRLLLADPTEGKKGIAAMRCYTLDGKRLDFPQRYGIPFAPAPGGKGFLVVGLEDTLQQPFELENARGKALHAYHVGFDGNVLRKSTGSCTERFAPFKSVSPDGSYIAWFSEEDNKAALETMRPGTEEFLQTGLTYLVENLSEGTTRKLRDTPPGRQVVPLADGRVLSWLFAPRGSTLRVWSADGTRFGEFTVPRTKPLLLGQTLYCLPGGSNSIQVIDLSKIQP